MPSTRINTAPNRDEQFIVVNKYPYPCLKPGIEPDSCWWPPLPVSGRKQVSVHVIELQDNPLGCCEKSEELDEIKKYRAIKFNVKDRAE